MGNPHPSCRQRGAVAVMALILLVALLGFAALTVDVGYIYNVRAELQNAADAAALSGLPLLPDQGIARGTALTYANMNYRRYGTIVEDEDIVLGNWDWDTSVFTANGTPVNAVHVLTHRSQKSGNSVALFFSRIFGKQSTDVSASATAALGRPQPWEVVIAQDVTGSFVDEIDEARLADQDLLDCLHDNAPQTILGLITFTGYGQTLAGLQDVETEYAQLSTKIGQIKNCGESGMPPCSGTNIGAGLDQAITVLTASSSAGNFPRAIILVTDGMPNSSLPGYTDADLTAWAVQSADEADSLGISVFTLFYSGNDGTPGASDFLAGLVRGEGTAYETADPNEIGEKLQKICRDGMKALLVE